MADAKVFMNATDIILDLKTQLCDKRGINDLSTRCALTDLINAAVNAGRVEAYEEIKNSHDYDWYMQARECFGKAARLDAPRLQERLNKLYKTTLQKRTLELIQQKLSGDYNE